MYKNILKYIGILQNYLYYLTIHINTRKWIIVLVIQRKVYRQRNLKLKKPNSLHYYLKERKMQTLPLEIWPEHPFSIHMTRILLPLKDI